MRSGASSTSTFAASTIAQAVAGIERVLQMKADFVFIAECGGNAALRPLRVGIGNLALGEDYDPAGAGQFDGGAQSGHPGTNDQKVSFGRHGLH